LEEKKPAEDAPIEVVSDDHPEGAIDIEIVKIVGEDFLTSYGLDAMKVVLSYPVFMPKSSTHRMHDPG
jgi:hypothetical protein